MSDKLTLKTWNVGYTRIFTMIEVLDLTLKINREIEVKEHKSIDIDETFSGVWNHRPSVIVSKIKESTKDTQPLHSSRVDPKRPSKTRQRSIDTDTLSSLLDPNLGDPQPTRREKKYFRVIEEHLMNPKEYRTVRVP